MRAVVLVLVAAVSLAYSATYTTKYDNIDLDEILSNERLYKKYFDCLMDKGKCTPDGKELKDTIPDALATECSKCSDKHREGAEKVVRYLYEKRPEDFKQLEQKYDPKGVYAKKYKLEADKRGIKL